jgi:hypothetical protein
MRFQTACCAVLGLLLTGSMHAQVLPPPNPDIVKALQRERELLVSSGKVSMSQMSHDLLQTVSESEALDRSGNDRESLTHLLTLEKYAPLENLPSYDVQMLCSWLYMKLGDKARSGDCGQRASAMREILYKDSGSGANPGDPVHVIMPSDMIEWMRLQLAKASSVQAYAFNGVELQKVTYSDPLTKGQSAVVYFAPDPRVAAQMRSQTPPDIFAPLPIASMQPLQQQAIEQAHDKRMQFLADKSFNYPALLQLSKTSLKQATLLESQGDYAGALAELKNIQRLRPIEDTPLVDVIGTYSALLGKTGNADAQAKMRLYLFGILQDIAHSGDGLSQQTAIHVIAVAEEYSWLRQKGLHMDKQSLINAGSSVYDALQTSDAQGHSKTYYFDVTGFYQREGER